MIHNLHFRRGLTLNVLAIMMLLPGLGWAQPWTYDFGTGTGTHPTNTVSTTFLTSTPINGGTYRVRTGSAGGTMVLANPGTSLGTATELQINAATSTSTNKFGVYDWATPSTAAYMKAKIRTTSTANGNLAICLGINTLATTNNGYTGEYATSLASMVITYTSGAISVVNRRNAGATTAITGSGLAKGTDQLIEIYANNGSGSVNYTKGGTNTLTTKTWDLWVDGVKISSAAPYATAGTLAAGTNLSGLGFFAESSTGNAAFIYIDDLEYSNALPSGATVPTVTTQAVTAIGTITATGNGNITATGGANATVRGFCWDVYANPDPDISDSHSTESGSFGTGAFTGSITSISAETRYKAVAYATNPTGTGYGSAVNFWTFSLEPSAHSTTFSNSVISQTQIDLSFDAASTITNADGYIILQKSGSAPTGVPTDGNGYTAGATIGDGTVAAIVTSSSATSASISSLSAGTHYYFTLIPYNYNGTNNETYNYNTDGTIPSTNGTTLAPLASTSEVSGPALGSQPDPVLLSSLATTDASAVRVLDMDVYDYGTDGEPTKITQVTIKSGTNNTANWANTIQGAKLSLDAGSTFVTIGTPTITSSSIVIPISSGDLNIGDADAQTLSLYVYLKSSGLTDDQILEFKVDATAASHGFIADGTGSTFLATFASAPVSNQILIDVVATKLKFIQQPTSLLMNSIMAPAVTIEATDVNNNRDLGKTGSVSLSSSGTMTGPVTATLASGFGTFGNIIHTVAGNTLALTASLSGLTNAVSNSFSIFSALAAGDILFLGYGTDDPDKFAFLVRSTIPDGTQINFTDNAWNGTNLLSNENTGTYTAPAGGLVTGSIVQIQGTTVTGGGTMSFGLTGLSTSGDQILAYQGSSLSPSFIAGVSSTGWISSGTPSTNQSYLPSPLAIYSSAISFSSEDDNGYYSGPMTLANGALPALICNSANWTRSSTIQTFPAWSFTIGTATLIDINATAQDLTINSGESLSINSGKGLSVVGTFTNNAGAASLVVSSGGSLIEKSGVAATVEREITDAVWHLISVPNNNTTANTFFGDYLQSWDETQAKWTDIKIASTLLNPVQGYDLWNMTGATKTYTFTGPLNTGDQSQAITYTNLPATGNDGANLLGNPYPSYIDWSGLNGTYGAVYYFNGTAYESWNGIGIGTGSQFVAPMQGFFIVAPANGTFSLTYNNRAHSNASYYKSGSEISNGIVLETTSNGYSDKLFVLFDPEATENFDLQHDAYKFMSETTGLSQLYSFTGEKKLSIDVRPVCETIQLGFTNDQQGVYQIGIQENSGISNATLEDTKTGIFSDLMKGSYSFSYTPGENEQRFLLHFSALSVNETGNSIANIYSNSRTVFVDLKDNAKGDIYIYTVAGQLVSTTKAAQGINKINLANTGNYIVKVITDKSTMVKKVFIQ